MYSNRDLFTLLVLTTSMTASLSIASLPPALSGVEVVTGRKVLSDLAAPARGTVVVFLSAKCPCSASHEGELKELHKSYSNQGFQFLGVHSNRDENSELTRGHFKESSLPFPVIHDAENQLADAFHALKTPHVFILGKRQEILYQGGVDDSRVHSEAKKFYLRDALAAITEGKEPPLKETRTLGCVIQR